jgi:hypothetical protein
MEERERPSFQTGRPQRRPGQAGPPDSEPRQIRANLGCGPYVVEWQLADVSGPQITEAVRDARAWAACAR